MLEALERNGIKMKKCIVAILMILLLFTMFFSTVYAADSNNQVVENQTTDRAIDEETESQLVELKENVCRILLFYLMKIRNRLVFVV